MGLGSFLGKLVGVGIGDGVEKIANVVDKFVETPEEKQAAKVVIMKLQQNADLAQTEINKIEAGHRTIFVAGWRPFIGWVCGMGLAYHFILQPFMEFIIRIAMKSPPDLPHIAIGSLVTILLAMLGMSATRTYEKDKGISA